MASKSVVKSKKKVDQNMLRNLMKQEKAKLAASTQAKKIDSPFAKYSSVGQLSCSLCHVPIKSDRMWPAHASGRTHVENVAKLKTLQQNLNQKGSGATSGQKRKGEDGGPGRKRQRSASEQVGEVQLSHLQHYDSDDSDDDEVMKTDETDKTDEAEKALPSDFFDSKAGKASEEMEPPKQMSDKLPEKFFDNPVKDAKVRQVKYVDAAEEEWEKFQKAIAEESHISEAIVEEEDETEKTHRQLSEIDEQIAYWSRVHSLEEKKDEIKVRRGGEGSSQDKEMEVDDDDDIDEEEIEALDNWKWKGMKM